MKFLRKVQMGLLAALVVSLGGIACSEPIETEIQTIGTVKVGNVFKIAIKIDSDTPAEDVYGQCFDMIYDTAKMTFANVVEINQGGGLPFSYYTQNYRNGDPGRLVVCVSKEGQVGGSNGYGELVRISFNGVGSGSTTINFSDQYLVHSTGNQGSIKMSSAVISIAP